MRKIQVREAAWFVRLLLLTGFSLPYLGLLIYSITPESDAFARSGSLLVAVSIALVYFNHFFGKDVMVSKELLSAATQLRGVAPNSFREVLDRVEPSVRENIENLKISSIDELIEHVSRTSGTVGSVSGFVRTAEFSVGIIGTLIWGFGDLRWFAQMFYFLLVVFSILIYRYRCTLFK